MKETMFARLIHGWSVVDLVYRRRLDQPDVKSDNTYARVYAGGLLIVISVAMLVYYIYVCYRHVATQQELNKGRADLTGHNCSSTSSSSSSMFKLQAQSPPPHLPNGQLINTVDVAALRRSIRIQQQQQQQQQQR